ncbi:helix-turn-helix transcriptional regulator [Spirosoma sp. BT702]|uniref:Helix-turn-helix transcriptional regulator n=1 Tax=Spirosoma profusum TaxID=2771354 RepID=A0A926Y3N1_9BACT|nr:helix-turn-helix domain-containing protein [Spirosoma profusum]MBD2704282.1 helix-turn-helix transcriptional regulator [Spirosoma profusum]
MQTLPLRLDLFTILIFLGVAQGLFLGVFFLTGQRRASLANRCLGCYLLSVSAIMLEIGLEYSNYMFQTLALVDYGELFNFVLGPLFYFFVFAKLNRRLPRHWGWHLLPGAIWAINAMTWIFQPIEFKYNSYLHAFHPELPYVTAQEYLPEDFTNLRGYINQMTLISCLVYTVLSVLEVWDAFRKADLPLLGKAPAALAMARNVAAFTMVFPLLIGVIKASYQEDMGDHFLAAYLTVTIYATTLLVMRGSNVLQEEVEETAPDEQSSEEPRKKYEKSSLSDEQEEALLARLNQVMDTEKPYLESDLSLPKLAQRLNTSPHHLSQILNDRLGQNFFDLLATHRIAEAQIMLNNPAIKHLKIDEIAERVGYNSPSAFHTAFKRITNLTPAQFRADRMGRKLYRQ